MLEGIYYRRLELNHAFRIGNDVKDNHGDRLSYTFLVTNTNANFGFKYAMVLQEGDHEGAQNPFFSYTIQKGSNPNVVSNNPLNPNFLITSKQIIADINNPFFEVVNEVVWRDWSWECYDLSEYIGDTVTISFYAADCPYGGHWGYAYIDALCSENQPQPDLIVKQTYCISDDIVINCSNTENEDSYFISVQECDQWWNPTGQEYYEWFIAQQAGQIDLNQFLNSKGAKFKCNQYYRVKIAASNNCEPWVELTKRIYVYCPDINMFPDLKYCCGDQPQTVIFGPISDTPGILTSWSVGGGVSVQGNPTNQINATLYATSNGWVEYTVTQVSGGDKPIPYSYCSATERVNIFFYDDFEVFIDTNVIDCCHQELCARVEFKEECNKWSSLSEEQQNEFLESLEFQWSNGSKSQCIEVGGPTQTYSVTVSAAQCFTHTVSHNYIQSEFTQNSYEYPVTLNANNALIAGNSGTNGKLYIIASYMDNGAPYYPPLGTNQGIYKADSIKLELYNRWGQLFKEIKFKDCGQLSQGDVYWDGSDQYGNYVQDGVYIYKLYIKPCGGNWRPYCKTNLGTNISILNGDCLKYCWGHIPGRPWYYFGWYCCERAVVNGDCAYRVTVLK